MYMITEDIHDSKIIDALANGNYESPTYVTIDQDECVILYDGHIKHACDIKENDILLGLNDEQVVVRTCKLQNDLVVRSFTCPQTSETFSVLHPDTVVVAQNNKTVKELSPRGVMPFPVDPYICSYVIGLDRAYEEDNMLICITDTRIKAFINNYITHSDNTMRINKEGPNAYSMRDDMDQIFYNVVCTLIQYTQEDITRLLAGAIDSSGTVSGMSVDFAFGDEYDLYFTTIKYICLLLGITYECSMTKLSYKVSHTIHNNVYVKITLKNALKYVSTVLYPNANLAQEFPNQAKYDIYMGNVKTVNCVQLGVDESIVLANGFAIQPLLVAVQKMKIKKES